MHSFCESFLLFRGDDFQIGRRSGERRNFIARARAARAQTSSQALPKRPFSSYLYVRHLNSPPDSRAELGEPCLTRQLSLKSTNNYFKLPSFFGAVFL